MAFLKSINRKLDWMIMLMEVWSIESEIKELKDKTANKIDLEKLSRLEKRVDVVGKTLQNRRVSIFSK